MWGIIIICVIVILCLIGCVRSYASNLEIARNTLKSLEDNNRSLKKVVTDTQEQIKNLKISHKKEITVAQYKFDYIAQLYPNINNLFEGEKIVFDENDVRRRVKSLFETIDILNHPKNEKNREIISLKARIDLLEAAQSNLKAIPYMSAMIADYETYGLEVLAKQLDWGYSWEREKKVMSIREIRKVAKEMAEKNLEAKYQLAYLLHLFPALEDVIETDFKQLPVVEVKDLSEYDKTRDWLSKDEYQHLSTSERNQLALDRYKESHSKTKWQIGRDYELYVGYVYSQKGYDIDYFGSYMGLGDLGRDLIAKKGNSTLIIQCKYWGQDKTIHEKHITKLYGTLVCYCMENNIPKKNVKGVLVTNIQLSEQAKKMANYLKIQYNENLEKGEYPCIKCNIGHSKLGETKIYHLPFDQQYDTTKIDSQGEFFAMTVKQAEDAGFRRALKWVHND